VQSTENAGQIGRDDEQQGKETTLDEMRSLCYVAVAFALAIPGVEGQPRPSAAELVKEFETTTVFWQQAEIAMRIIATHDASVLPRLESWLTIDDRHLRGNAALIFAGLGDSRGFDAITAILTDRSQRGPGQGIVSATSIGGFSVRQQIRADRYYAAHLLGDLKDPRAVPILVPLLTDPEVSVVPWSLGQIGDRSAIPPLVQQLSDSDPDLRVLAIYALADLKATEALPKLRELVGDTQRRTFDKLETVGEAARAAIAKVESGVGR
jgi:HEAT repeat protein